MVVFSGERSGVAVTRKGTGAGWKSWMMLGAWTVRLNENLGMESR